MPKDKEFIIDGRCGWKIRLQRTSSDEVTAGDGCDITHSRIDPATGKAMFYEYSTIGTRFGNGLLIQEPSLAIPLSNFADRIFNHTNGFVVGICVVGEDGRVIPECRYSLSNLFFMSGKSLEIKPDGEVLLDKMSIGWVNVLFSPDKNRLRAGDFGKNEAYVALVTGHRSEDIRVAEMGDMIIESRHKLPIA